MQNTNAVNQPDGKLHDTMQTNTTQANSEFVQNMNNAVHDIANPHADLKLSPEEMEELYSRPYMNPQFAAQGHQPESNELLKAEQELVESKQEKCVEIIRQNGEIHEILETIKGDGDIDQITGG